MEATFLKQFIASNGNFLDVMLNAITQQFSPINLSKHEVFLEQGQISRRLLFVEQGCLRAYTYDYEGAEVTTAFYASQSMVYEANSFFNRTPSLETIEALCNCTAWMLDYNTTITLSAQNPVFMQFGRMLLIREYTLLKHRVLSTATQTAEQRYLQLVTQDPNIFRYASLKHIASYLGITDSSLSRIRRQMSKQKSIQ